MNNQVYPDHLSSIGAQKANLIALLAYLAPVVLAWIPGLRYLSWVVPLVFFLMEKNSEFVKFHALQSLVLHAVSALVGFVVSVVIGGVVAASVMSYNALSTGLGALGVIGVLSTVIAVGFAVFAIIAMTKAFAYQIYYIPLIGGLTERLQKQLGPKV